MKKLIMLFSLVWIITLGACTSSSNEADDNDVDVIEQEPEVESEVQESELQAVTTSFRDTEFGEGLEGYYGFTIVEEMNDGVTASVTAETNSRYSENIPIAQGTITLYLAVEHDELLLTMITRHNAAYDLVEIQERNLGLIDPDSVSDLSFLDAEKLAEISEFIHDNFYELTAENIAYQWDHSIYRIIDGNINRAISNLPGVIRRIEGEEMEIQSVTDEFLVFNREDSTVKDSQGNLIAQGYRVDHDYEPIYDGRINFEGDEIDAVYEAIRNLAEENKEAPW